MIYSVELKTDITDKYISIIVLSDLRHTSESYVRLLQFTCQLTCQHFEPKNHLNYGT